MSTDGMDWEECLRDGQQAEEQYDYDRALASYRRAAELNDDEESLLELSRFLFEIYAAYDEVVALFEGRSRQLRGRDLLRKRYARSLWLTGNAEQADEQYTEVSPANLEARDHHFIGLIRRDAGEIPEAIEQLTRAVELEPADGQIAADLKQVRELLADEAGVFVRQAAELRESDPGRAIEILKQMYASGLRHSDAVELMRSCEELLTARRIAELMAAAEGSDDPLEQIARYKAVLALQPAHQIALDRLGSLRESDLARRLPALFEEGLELGVAGEIERALGCYLQIIAEENHMEFLSDWDPEVDELWLLARDYVNHVGQRQAEKMSAQLASLFAARQEFDQGEIPAADRLAALGRHFRDFEPFSALLEEVEEQDRERRRSEASSLYRQAIACEKRGDLSDALAAYDRAVQAFGGDFEDTAERRRAVKQKQQRADDRAGMRKLLAELTRKEQWFRARRLLDAHRDDPDPELKAIRDEVLLAISTNYTSRRVESLEAEAPGNLSLDALTADGNLSFSLGDRGALLVTSSRHVALLQLPELAPRGVWQLPESLVFDQRTDLHCLGWSIDSLQLIAFQRSSGRVQLFSVTRSALELSDVIDLSGEADWSKAMVSSSAHREERRLSILCTTNDRRRPTRLLQVGLDECRVVNQEEYGFPAFHLVSVVGDGRLMFNRHFDFQRGLTPGFFNLALIDGRGRPAEKFFFEDVLDDIATLDWAARDPRNGWLHLNYRSVNPLTGDVVPDSMGYMVIRDDNSLFYQSSRPEHLVGTKRKITAPFALTRDGETLLVGYREEDEGGVQMLVSDDFTRTVDLPLGPMIPRQVQTAADGRVAVVLAENPDGDAILKVIDLVDKRWF